MPETSTNERRGLIGRLVERGVVQDLEQLAQMLAERGISESDATLEADLAALGLDLPEAGLIAETKPRPKPEKGNVQKVGGYVVKPIDADNPMPELKPPKKRGPKPAAPGFKRTSVDLPEDKLKAIKIQAINEGRPMRELVEDALDRYMKRKAS